MLICQRCRGTESCYHEFDMLCDNARGPKYALRNLATVSYRHVCTYVCNGLSCGQPIAPRCAGPTNHFTWCGRRQTRLSVFRSTAAY